MFVNYWILYNLLVFIFLLSPVRISISAQTPDPLSTPEEDEILKINTQLIQTGVSVFDKKGKFVDGLGRDDFELRVDGKPVSISFFESLTENRLPQNSKAANPQENRADNNVSPNNRPGRIILFVVDDVHLSLDSHVRSRNMILNFIDREKQSKDLVAIVSSSGKIGFLQQFTDNKIVLRAAVDRLIFSKKTANDHGYPPMTEFEAFAIDYRDQEVTDKFAVLVMREAPGTTLENAREQVRSRARMVLEQTDAINPNTYSVLERSIRASGQLTGRKIVFFLSDGFLLNSSNSNATDYMQRITDAAARVNAVIYSLDAKGLDASLPEGTAASFRLQADERFIAQNGLNLLANNTGGRFIHNTNDLQGSLADPLSEASRFYLLAWDPESENSKSEKLRKIEVSVKGRPELKVRLQNGYLEAKAKNNEQTKSENKQNTSSDSAASIPERQLNKALVSRFPLQDLPISLMVNYAEGQSQGSNSSGFLQIKSEALEFSQEADKYSANVDLVGVIYNSKGEKEGSFRKLVNASYPANKKTARQNIFYNFHQKLKPGLYQVRVAARDMKNGRLGSTVQWLEIPDLAKGKLTLSSILLSQRAISQSTNVSDTDDSLLNIDRLFKRSDHLQYTFFVYNFSGQDNPQITARIQVLLNGKLLAETPEAKVPFNEKNPSNLAYAGEIPLNPFPPGRYELQITVKDKIAGTQTVQESGFEIK